MECLQIDSENIDGRFEKDDFYESIQAPKWVDFTVPLQAVDDHAWFCGRTGCTHETKTILQELNQRCANSFEASMTSANMRGLLPAKTHSAGVAVKKTTRAVVSSSLSSLSEIKAACTKNKVLYYTQMTSIGESKGGTIKNDRQQQASENENPNRACKFQDGACKKPTPKALEGITRQAVRALNRGASIRSVKTLSEQVSLSQSGPVLEANKSVFIFGKRDPPHVKSCFNKVFDKETHSDLKSKTAKNKIAGRTRFFSRLSPTARNPCLSASLAMPIVSRSAANARPLHGVYLGNDKFAECKPPRVVKDVRVTVQVHACRTRNDPKKEVPVLKEGKVQERDSQKDGELQKNDTALLSNKQVPHLPLMINNDELGIGNKDSSIAHNASTKEQHTQREFEEGDTVCHIESLAPAMVQDLLPALSNSVEDNQLPHSFQGVVEESKGSNIVKESKCKDILTREKEDSITNTFEKFLENLRITSHRDASVSNEGNCKSYQNLCQADCVTEKIISNVRSADEREMIVTHRCAIDQESIRTQHVDNDVRKYEAVISNHTECAGEGDLVQSHIEKNALQHDLNADESKKVVTCSHLSTEVSQMSKPLSSNDWSSVEGSSAKNEGPLSVENDNGFKKIEQKQKFQFTKDWQRHTGTKRKSSELNVHCSSKDHKDEMLKVNQSSSTAKVPMIPASESYGLQHSCEEHHKKLKTATQNFKPFRFRTEERGALKELGLGRKESGMRNSKEMVHHALQMPSFGRPFRPQRSTKKLTIPKEPKFHVSRTKYTSTSRATGLATAS